MDTREKIVGLYLDGLSYNEIALRLRMTRSAVAGHVNRWRASGAWMAPSVVTRRRDPFIMPGKTYVEAMADADKKFCRALAEAFQRGDHLPAMKVAA